MASAMGKRRNVVFLSLDGGSRGGFEALRWAASALFSSVSHGSADSKSTNEGGRNRRLPPHEPSLNPVQSVFSVKMLALLTLMGGVRLVFADADAVLAGARVLVPPGI